MVEHRPTAGNYFGQIVYWISALPVKTVANRVNKVSKGRWGEREEGGVLSPTKIFEWRWKSKKNLFLTVIFLLSLYMEYFASFIADKFRWVYQNSFQGSRWDNTKRYNYYEGNRIFSWHTGCFEPFFINGCLDCNKIFWMDLKPTLPFQARILSHLITEGWLSSVFHFSSQSLRTGEWEGGMLYCWKQTGIQQNWSPSEWPL